VTTVRGTSRAPLTLVYRRDDLDQIVLQRRGLVLTCRGVDTESSSWRPCRPLPAVIERGELDRRRAVPLSPQTLHSADVVWKIDDAHDIRFTEANTWTRACPRRFFAWSAARGALTLLLSSAFRPSAVYFAARDTLPWSNDPLEGYRFWRPVRAVPDPSEVIISQDAVAEGE